jgi:hypothetical protein
MTTDRIAVSPIYRRSSVANQILKDVRSGMTSMATADTGSHSPSRRSYLAPFMEGPRPWLVLARNAIPVLGVYLLGWSASQTAFQIWFDGLTALGAMLGFHIRAVAARGSQPDVPSATRLPVLVLVWLLLWLLLGIPYWFTLFLLRTAVFVGDPDGLKFWNPGVLVALLFVVLSNYLEESRRGYDRLSDSRLRLEFNWDFSMHLARVAAMLLVSFILRLGLILGLALALSYVEIYPMRTLRFLGGDRTLEAGNEERSRD